MPLIPIEDLCRRILWSRLSKAEDILWVLLSLKSKFDVIRVSAVSVDVCVRRFERYLYLVFY